MINIGLNFVWKLPFGIKMSSRNIRVFLNGKDITNNCFEAFFPRWPFIPWLGNVGVYNKDMNGKHLVWNGKAEREHKQGIVFWIPKVISK